jgi:hypothetical protein
MPDHQGLFIVSRQLHASDSKQEKTIPKYNVQLTTTVR